MPKNTTEYRCSNCGFVSSKWLGKCPECSSWNSFVEQDKISSKTALEKKNLSVGNSSTGQVESLETAWNNAEKVGQKRLFGFSTTLLNDFWGGGIVAGSLTLLAGEPGLGKSTFALQLLRALNNDSINLLYITAEESVNELARRAKRLKIPGNILCLQANNFEQIERSLNNVKPDLVILDSIQTIYSNDISSNPGSITQVSTLTNQFLGISKSQNIAIVLIGHVNKEGQIAGPKTLEHMVDSVLLLESADSPLYRTLTFSKHRFGTTNNLLLLKMEGEGLSIVADPSLALIENLEVGTGICYGIAMEKNQPFVVEVQALVSSSGGKGSFGRRESIGLKNSKLNIILAIAEKYLDLDFKDRDVYIQLSGVPKNLVDDSLDLAILLAILSSMRDKGVTDMLAMKSKKVTKINPKSVFAGRLTFSGKLRAATSLDMRQNTAKKLGFEFNPAIEIGEIRGV